MNILAIDDSKLIRNMLNNVLSGAGHTLAMAADGKEGADMAAASQFDLIITDINMPEINGLDLARLLREKEEYKTIPIIFLTTEASDEFKAPFESVAKRCNFPSDPYPHPARWVDVKTSWEGETTGVLSG